MKICNLNTSCKYKKIKKIYIYVKKLIGYTCTHTHSIIFQGIKINRNNILYA